MCNLVSVRCSIISIKHRSECTARTLGVREAHGLAANPSFTPHVGLVARLLTIVRCCGGASSAIDPNKPGFGLSRGRGDEGFPCLGRAW